MLNNLNRCIVSTRKDYILKFLKQNANTEYTAEEIAKHITFHSTPHQVASAIQTMLPWDKRQLNIDKTHHPFLYSYI